MEDKKFYNLRFGDHYAIARAPKNSEPLIFPNDLFLSIWAPPLFTIPKNDGIVADYMVSNLGGRFCSDTIKNIIEKNKLATESIQWLPINIFIEETGETLRYHHLHFPARTDCLNHKLCKFVNGELAAPFYSYEKIKNRHIFNCPEGYETIITIVSEDMLKALEESECTGMSFQPANVVYDEEESPSTQPF